MKFIVSSTLLLKNLQAISGVLSTNNTLPILDNFLFELKEEALTVYASDLETTMTVKLPINMSEETGSVAIPAKILIDTLKTFADIPITFNINSSNYGIEISTDEGKYRLAGFNADEYPKLPVKEGTKKLQMPSSALATAINKTLFATGNDELRPVMSGVFCEMDGDGTNFVATDAHKLVRYRRNDVAPADEDAASFIIPKKPLTQLKNILANSEEEVEVEYNEKHAFFSYNHINLICRLIEGKYPNYDAVIPKENPNKLIINRIQLLNSLKRVSIFANQSTHQVRFKISGQELILSAEDVDYANEARERLSCNFEGEDLEIGFNSKFIIDMLNNVNNENVMLEMSTPNRAGILLPIEEEKEGDETTSPEKILMLVMPVMLNN